MHFAKAKYFIGISAGILTAFQALAQENSPYSRYGLGDLTNSTNVVSRAMGGVSQAYGSGQFINFNNPASYSGLQLTTFDFGIEGKLNSISDQHSSSQSGNGTLSFLQFGFPLKAGGGWGLTFGLVPVSRVHYNIQQNDSLPGISKVSYLYQGNGGTYQAFLGTGYKIGNFSLGINAGYFFGNIQTATLAIYPADSTNIFNSNSSSTLSIGSFFWSAGAQYEAKLNKNLWLQMGVSGSLRQDLNAKKGELRETITSSGDPANTLPVNQDTAFYTSGIKGHVVYPAQFSAGIVLHDALHWSVGADYSMGKWSDFRNYKLPDSSVGNNWKFSIGGQYTPDLTSVTAGYLARVTYRAGFYYGKDYIYYAGQSLPQYALTFGFGFPVRHDPRTFQYTSINTSFEVGRRGSTSDPLTENFFRFTVGFSLNDLWFIKRKFQ